MTEREAFKVGFLARCAEEGLTTDQIQARIEKVAFPGQAVLAGLAGGVWDLAKNAPTLGIGLAAAGGAGAGYLGAKLREGHVDPQEAQKQETIATYNAFAEQLRQQHALRRRGRTKPLRVNIG